MPSDRVARGLVAVAAAAGLLGLGSTLCPGSRTVTAEVAARENPRQTARPAQTARPVTAPEPAGPALVAPETARDEAAHAHGDEAAHAHGDEGCPDDGDLLLEALRQDPARVDQLVELLRAGSLEEVGQVTTTLGRFRDVRILRGAAALADAQDAEPWRRAMALEVLDGLDAGPAAPVALRALADRDPVVRRAAVHAVPPRASIDPERAPTVIAALGAALRRDADAEVRRRAALAIGRWAVDADELAPVLTALIRDPSPDVRAGAAFACELAAKDAPRVRHALLRSMEPGEAPLVRENAARALEVLGPLAEHERRALQRVAAELPAEY